MTEIQCPACSALLNLAIVPTIALSSHSASSAPAAEITASTPGNQKEKERLAKFNADVASALREFVTVHPWEGHRLPSFIHRDFMRWCAEGPDDSSPRLWAAHNAITKNRMSKLLVSEIGATFYKGPSGREYRLPDALQPKAGGGDTAAGLSVDAPADVPLTVGGGLVPAAGLDLAGGGELEITGVASRPLAEHVSKVREQAQAEAAAAAVVPVSPDEAVRNLVTGLGAVKVGSVDYMFVTKDGVQTKVPLNRNSEEHVVQQEFSPLPDNMVLDGPSVFPVEAGAAPAEPSGSWWVYLTDDESNYSPEELFIVAVERLPDRLVLAGDPLLRFDQEGAPYLQCPVHSTDGAPAGTGEVRVPLPWLKEDEAEAAAVPLPSSEQLAAAAGHDALERARARSSAPAAAVFLATEDYQGVDPGDWG